MPRPATRTAADRADDYLADQIARLDGELEAMQQATSAQAIAKAVEDGIMRAAANPALWAAASAAIQSQAKARAGGWLFQGIGAIFSRAGWIIMVLVAVYTLGGWSAVAALFKAWWSGAGGHS